jgi:hypothetical protein
MTCYQQALDVFRREADGAGGGGRTFGNRDVLKHSMDHSQDLFDLSRRQKLDELLLSKKMNGKRGDGRK